jgi:Gluconate 2-dehydrogenase subunit 3
VNRRELCRALGAAVASPALARLSADDLWTVGRRAHRQGAVRAFQVLDPHQAATVALIADLIIPETDTPGASAARVPEFIDLLLGEWAPDDDRKQFLEGLADVDARAHALSAADFLGAAAPQRAAILGALDSEAQARRKAKSGGKPGFFEQMKFLTVFGYCTSEVGAKGELHYEVIPGSFDACTEPDRWRAAPGDF